MSDAILDIFREEARDHLGALERGFLDLEGATALESRRPIIDELFRHAHSLKSDAKVVGLTDLKQAAQALEDVLDDLREKPETIDRSAIDRGLAHFDAVRAAFERWHGGSSVGLQSTIISQPQQPSRPLVAAETHTAHSDQAAAKGAISNADGEPTTPAPGDSEVPEQNAASRSAGQGGEIFTVRVSSERLDRMLSLAGEIRISQGAGGTVAGNLAEVRLQVAGLRHAWQRQSANENRLTLDGILDQLRRIEGELDKKRSREGLLAESLETEIRESRLLPLVMLTNSLRRAVRDLAQSLGKSIHYEADVGKVMLDKAVIEALREPLLQILRNASDHGIESPEDRRAAGKPVMGTIRVDASRQGAMVSIRVTDDGRGISYDRIRDRLRRKGKLGETEIARLNLAELAEHVFEAGFSTASAGEISGRGVGLDLALHAIRALSGTLTVASDGQRGTTFVINVPVTVSTIRIVTAIVGSQVVGVPSSMILRTSRILRSQLSELEGRPVLSLDGEAVPWMLLSDLLGLPASQRRSENQPISFLVVNRNGRLLALAVDDLEDESEVLLKPLGFPLGRLSGVLGATIRTDGTVQLVLDLATLSLPGEERVPAAAVARPKAAARILIVDDSPTTRAVLRNVFTAAGYWVRTATDGVDALERLRTQSVDLVVSDVEMPRLNGLDLTRQIKSKYRLPVILVTGREKEEHRREGLKAGADAYVVKSTFQGQGLMDIVRQFV